MNAFSPRWDQDPQVLSPVGRPIEEQLAVRPRRQELDGFEPVYSDFVDYIIRCTHRIWEEKNVGLCRTHYAPDVVMHTLAGPTFGVEAVVQATVGALTGYPDRVVIGEDVIWSEDAPGLFLSSHRIMSQATHQGDDALSPATGRQAGVMTIADCLCRKNLIVEEWLVRDNLTAVRLIGLDPAQVAVASALADGDGDPARHHWRRDWMDAVRAAEPGLPPEDHPAFVPAQALRRAMVDDLYGEAAAACSPAVEVRWPSGRHGFGRGYWIGCLLQLRSQMHDPALRIDHYAARPLPGDDVAVAIRWSLTGRHQSHGLWGSPTGRDLLVLAVSHLRLRGGFVVEDMTVFDELSVLRQLAGGLGS